MPPQEPKLIILRGTLIGLTQLTIIFYFAGVFDLLFGFNQTSAGFNTLLLLFVLVPLLNLFGVIIEIRLSVRRFRSRNGAALILMPALAILFLVESLAIDFYLLTQVRLSPGSHRRPSTETPGQGVASSI